MRGGLSRSIQTCFKRQRQSRRGSGGGGLGGGGARAQRAASTHCWPHSHLGEAHTGGEGQSKRRSYSSPTPLSSSPLTCCLPPITHLLFLPPLPPQALLCSGAALEQHPMSKGPPSTPAASESFAPSPHSRAAPGRAPTGLLLRFSYSAICPPLPPLWELRSHCRVLPGEQQLSADTAAIPAAPGRGCNKFYGGTEGWGAAYG